jgi:hypothetical protein
MNYELNGVEAKGMWPTKRILVRLGVYDAKITSCEIILKEANVGYNLALFSSIWTIA